MTTVANPGGTPSVVYNRDGTTIQNVTATGSTQATATPAQRYSQRSVLIVTSSDRANGVVLPLSAEIGDEVLVYQAVSPSYGPFHVYPPSGHQFSVPGLGPNTPVIVNSYDATFMFLGNGLWGASSSANAAAAA